MDTVSYETKCKQNTRKIKLGQVRAGNWLCRVTSARDDQAWRPWCDVKSLEETEAIIANSKHKHINCLENCTQWHRCHCPACIAFTWYFLWNLNQNIIIIIIIIIIILLKFKFNAFLTLHNPHIASLIEAGRVTYNKIHYKYITLW